jgi:hypothetical protein
MAATNCLSYFTSDVFSYNNINGMVIRSSLALRVPSRILKITIVGGGGGAAGFISGGGGAGGTAILSLSDLDIETDVIYITIGAGGSTGGTTYAEVPGKVVMRATGGGYSGGSTAGQGGIGIGSGYGADFQLNIRGGPGESYGQELFSYSGGNTIFGGGGDYRNPYGTHGGGGLSGYGVGSSGIAILEW